MKRFFLPAILGMLFLTSSCIENIMPETTPQASINSFTLGYFTVLFHDVNYQGNDTVVEVSQPGIIYPMTIDQIRNRIYNIDSIDYNADVSSVSVSISADGAVIYRYLDDLEDGNTDILWSSEQHINFERPISFTVISSDDSYRRDYSFTLNRHTVFPDSLIWTGADSVGFPMVTPKSSAVKSDTVFTFATDAAGNAVVTCRPLLSGTWKSAVPMSGITADRWGGTVVVLGDSLYTVCSSSLFSSKDGINWTACAAGFKALFNTAGNDSMVWAVSDDGNLMYSCDMASWVKVQPLPAGFPDSCVVTSTYPLATNAGISRTVAIGLGADQQHASVWLKLSTDSVWLKVEPSSNSESLLPAMENLSMIRYDGSLFAFGSGLAGFWQSRDNGITWHWCDRYAEEYSSWNQYMQMPSGLKGFDGDFSYVTDRLGSVWIMTSDGKVWRGAVNRLNKR